MSLLRGKVAAVTGAASGLGRAIAKEFAANGAAVIALDLQEEQASEVLAELEAADATTARSFKALDVRDPEQVARVFAEIVASVGPIDVLVNSAGVREISDPLELEPREWENVLAVDLSGTFYCCQAAAREMARAGTGGSIINIASVAGLIGISGRVAYNAAKHGVIGVTKTLARDLAAHRIRINALCPGLVRTPANDFYFGDDEFLDTLATVVPFGRGGDPVEIARAAVFLASDMSSFVTGIALPVDGGWLAEKSYGPYNRDSPFHRPYQSVDARH